MRSSSRECNYYSPNLLRCSIPPLLEIKLSPVRWIHTSRTRRITETRKRHETEMAKAYPRIAILGAGPVGLTLSSLLERAGIPYTTYDLRPSPTNNPSSPYSPLVPSGSLDLHAESGLAALRACGLYERFRELKTDCEEECIIMDMHGDVKWHDDGIGGPGGPPGGPPGEEEGRPEIARNNLMELLLSSVPGERVRWEHKVLAVTPKESKGVDARSGYTLTFATPSLQEQKEEYDIVLGADGAWSRLRGLMTDTKPQYSSVSCITLTIPSISTAYPHLSTLLGKGTHQACAAGKGILSQRGSLDSARIYLMLRHPNETYLEDEGLVGISGEEMKRKLLGEGGVFEGWAEALRELVAVGCDEDVNGGKGKEGKVDAWPLYMLPIGHSWAHKQGITLLGDAAHLMTPFAGEGVNMGMLDALELTELLSPTLRACANEDAEAWGILDQALKVYEEKMFQRIEPIARETWGNLEMMFAKNAPEPFVEFFRSVFAMHGSGEEGER